MLGLVFLSFYVLERVVMGFLFLRFSSFGVFAKGWSEITSSFVFMIVELVLSLYREIA